MNSPTLTKEPLLKWTGGKRALAPRIIEQIGEFDGRYFEPFLGGGALFFRLAPEHAILGDLNADLVNCYRQVKNRPEELARRLAQMENSEAAYYRIRESSPRSDLSKAARMIYLATLAFNGIYRQNLKGKHNVPYGYKTHLDLPDRGLLLQYSQAMGKCRLRKGDFARTTRGARGGDVIYFDPPYTVAHNNNGFVKYNDKIFSWADQKRLAKLAGTLRNRGCKVLVSNADHPSIRALYPSFREIIIERNSVIAASPEYRKPITESLFVGCRVG
jgi:DNA adenine methylase